MTGTRADFGLMQSCLLQIQKHEALELNIVVTGTHLSAHYGHTIDDIVAVGLPVSETVKVELVVDSGAAMARNIGQMLLGLSDAFETLKPDVVLLLGDRGEMLAGALAAIHQNIPVAHIHGGERSGTVDESVRHAISKLAHLHFTATNDARERLIRMGESSSNIYVTGAPGLDGLRELASVSRVTLCQGVGFDPLKAVALFVFHPVLQELAQAGQVAEKILQALLAEGLQVLAMMPNSDAGNTAVRAALQRYMEHPQVRLLVHLPRSQFVSWMAVCDVMAGNSSSGIIEAATFGTPVINMGIRQNLREPNLNIVDVASTDTTSLRLTLGSVLKKGRYTSDNCYGDGYAGTRICNYLASVPLGRELLLKSNSH